MFRVMLQATRDRRLELGVLRPHAIDVVELDGDARRFGVESRTPALEGRGKGVVPSQLDQAHRASVPSERVERLTYLESYDTRLDGAAAIPCSADADAGAWCAREPVG